MIKTTHKSRRIDGYIKNKSTNNGLNTGVYKMYTYKMYIPFMCIRNVTFQSILDNILTYVFYENNEIRLFSQFSVKGNLSWSRGDMYVVKRPNLCVTC